MTQDQNAFYEPFAKWIGSLGDDAQALVGLVGVDSLSENARARIVGGLHYLFKTLDLIPDGIDEIGYLDDAFVLRVSAELAVMDAGMEGDTADEVAALMRLAEDCEVVRDFLGDDYGRLRNYVKGLRQSSARGRSVQDVLSSAESQAALANEVHAFAAGFAPPTFRHQEKNLIKMRAFFDAKLPR